MIFLNRQSVLFIWILLLVDADQTHPRNDSMVLSVMKSIVSNAETRIRPNIFGPPVQVKCDFFIQSLGPINEIGMDYSIEIYFRQRWVDPRLSFTGYDSPVKLLPSDVDMLWLPDVFFPNEKDGHLHTISVPNRAITVYPNGTIRYSARVTLRLSCMMLLMNFPLDYQDCHLKISTYSYDNSEVVLTWLDDDPVELHRDEFSLPQFELLNVSVRKCHLSNRLGNYSCLQATFHLKREIGFYILQTYVPSILIVTLSWVSFWIHRDAVPARITLGVTTVLTMTTQLSTSRSNSMLVSYPKSIDVWYASCMMFVFASLLEYAVVNVMSRREKSSRAAHSSGSASSSRIAHSGTQAEMDFFIENRNPTNRGTHHRSCDRQAVDSTSSPRHLADDIRMYFKLLNAKMIDRIARAMFPALFAVFNLVYWAVYARPVVFN